MAWIDDRFWAHPKVTLLANDKAKWVAVAGILYSHGFGLYGRLTRQHQKAIGCTPAIRADLIRVGLWDDEGSDIFIHDWDEHNGKRDRQIEARRASDRERKRREREERKAQQQAETPEKSARTSSGRHASRPADVTAMSSRARAGAPLMTNDRVTTTQRAVSEGPEEPPPLEPPDWVDLTAPPLNGNSPGTELATPELRSIA